MDDLPEIEPPSKAWKAFGFAFIFLTAVALFALFYLTPKAYSQERPHCGPAEILLRQFAEIHKERVIFEGVVPRDNGPIEVILMQSDKNTWTLFSVEGSVEGPIACIVASGRDANPSLADKGV